MSAPGYDPHQGQLFQAFRCRSTKKELKVHVQKGNTPNESFVLWSDIEDAFPTLKSVMKGEIVVHFLKDRDYNRIEPRRINYHPGAVLDVVTGSDAQLNPVFGVASVTNVKPEDTELTDPDGDFYNQATNDACSVARNTVTLSIADMNTDSQALVKNVEELPDHSRSSSSHPYETQPALSQEILQRLKQMDQSLEHKHHDTLELQRKVDELAQLHKNSKDELLKKQEETLDLQRQTLNQQTVILSHLKALLTQTYELHEYPIPRLFIVLPDTTGFLDHLTHPFTEKFRLYFLCECGTHTMPEDSKTQHEVHLAKHEGYELEDPMEFFKKHGSKLNTMMSVFKYGILAGSIVIPPLANFLTDAEAAQTYIYFEYVKKNISSLVDNTISVLQKLQKDGELMDGLVQENEGFKSLEAFEGADLRQLESYLKGKDEGRVLGNMYRIVTPEGHVKWVCLSHYRANYRESAMKSLRKAVESNQGTFVEDTGRIKIDIATSVLAREFYEAMTVAKGTHELEIKLKWNVTMDDLRELCDAVTKANVVRLALDGSNFKSPKMDVVNRGRRFDPIWKLASNARIQSLQLIGFDKFFFRVTKYTLPAPRLRLLSIESKAPLDAKAIKVFNGFLGHCSGLTALELKFKQHYLTTKTLMDELTKIRELESLTVDYGGFSTTTSFLNGQIQDAKITVPALSFISSVDLEFIRKVSFTQLVINSVPSSHVGDRLAALLCENHRLTRLQIGGGKVSDSDSKVEMRLQDLMKLFTPKMSGLLNSVSIDYGRFTLEANVMESRIQDITMRFEQLDKLTSDDLQFIQQGPYNLLRVKHTWDGNEDPLIGIFSQNSTLGYFQIQHHGKHRPTMTATNCVRLQDLVNKATEECANMQESFLVNCRGLTLAVSVPQGKTQMTMRLELLADLRPDDLEFIQQGLYDRLRIEHAWEEDEYRLADIIRQSSVLGYCQFKCHGEHCVTIVTSADMGLQDLVNLVTSETSANLESFSIGRQRLALAAGLSQGEIQSMNMAIEHLNKLTPDDLTFIHQGHVTQLTIDSALRPEDADRLSEILRHNTMLIRLQINYHDRTESATGPGLPLQNLVMFVTSEISSVFKSFSFSVHCQRFTLYSGISQGKIQDIIMTVDRLDNLTSDDLTFIRQGHLTQLVIGSAPLVKAGDLLSGILRHCPELKRFQIKFKTEDNPSDTTKRGIKFPELMSVILDTLTSLESLTVEYKNISIAANLVQRKIQDATLMIKRLDDLGSDYIRIIQDNCITKLAITHSLPGANENRLTEILSQCPSLDHIQVGCKWTRSLIIVKLVLSTREMIVANGCAFSLRTFELVDEDLAPFDILESRGDNTHIQSHLSFSEDSNSFAMRTWVRLGMMSKQDVGLMNDFILQYGWSIVFFAGYHGGNVLKAFNKMSKTRTSQLESLMVDSRDSLGDGVNLLDNIIQQSPNFMDLGLYAGNLVKSELQRALSLIIQYRVSLSKLQLWGSETSTFSIVASTFPTRNSFPVLKSFELWPSESAVIPPDFTSWIVAMVSAPLQQLASSPASEHLLQYTLADEQSTHSGSESVGSWTHLKKVMLCGVRLQPDEWRRIIEALDVSELEYLDLRENNIDRKQFKMLIDRIADNNAPKLPFRTLVIGGSNLVLTANPGTWDVIFAKLLEKAPSVKIIV